MKLTNPPCPHHKPISGGYFKYESKAEKGQEQRQCPVCLRWYFHGEYGRGWKAGVKLETDISRIIIKAV